MATTFQLPSTSPSASATSTPAQVFSDSGDDDDELLPYPAELQRSAFLAPDFEPQTYLSTLRNRHQTLEDLRSDLRQRSQLLNKELLNLVNGNYEEFLSLGAGLKGGEEKVDGVRVGVLGFGREVGNVRDVLDERLREVEGLVNEAKSVRTNVLFGRSLLELVEKVEELEDALEMRPGLEGQVSDEDDEDEPGRNKFVKKLVWLSAEVQLVQRLRDRIAAKHATAQSTAEQNPIIVSLQPRIAEVKRLLLLDLSSALKQAKATDDSNAVLEIARCFSALNAGTNRDGSRSNQP